MIKQAEGIIDVGRIDVREAETNAREAVSMLTEARGFKIANNEQYAQAAEFLKTIKSFARTVEEARKRITGPLDIAKKSVMDLFRGPEMALTEAEVAVKKVMLGYQQEQERIRKEQERKAQELAKKEEEKAKEKLEAKAAKAESRGDLETASELREKKEEVFVPRPIVASSMEKVAGVSTKKVWKARVNNKKKIPQDMLTATDRQKEAHEAHFNSIARSTKGSLPIAGVEFYSEETIAASV